jgi:hypothetical protein
MVNHLLSQARAHRSKPVQVAALLRIARLQTASDRGQARITFEIAVEEALRLQGRDRDYIVRLARLVARRNLSVTPRAQEINRPTKGTGSPVPQIAGPRRLKPLRYAFPDLPGQSQLFRV